MDLVERARIIYCTGFFITVSPDSIALVSKHAADNDKIYCMVRGPFPEHDRQHGCIVACAMVGDHSALSCACTLL
jgi:hypothetical protein